jgi:hypothetical protein
MVDGEMAESFEAERFASAAEPFADRVPGQRLTESAGPKRADEGIGGAGALGFAFAFPGPEIGECRGIPPKRHGATMAAFSRLGTDEEVRSARIDAKVIEPKGGDLGNAKAGTARETQDGAVEAGLGETFGAGGEMVEDG